MKTLLLILLLLTSCIICNAQNLIANSDFESNGQPLCSGWQDDCQRDITYLCTGIGDSSCSHSKFIYDAPAGGGLWSMKLTTYTEGFAQGIRTTLTGQFKGVYEFKVWLKLYQVGSGGQGWVTYKKGQLYTGQSTLIANSNSWSLVTLSDTIHTLSDTILIDLLGLRSSSSLPGGTVFVDLPEFRMIESWTGINDTKQNEETSLFPNPFSNQLTFSLADNEPTTISLYDFLGQQILQQTFTNSTTIKTEQLADDIYFYELRNNKGTLKTGKVVKQ